MKNKGFTLVELLAVVAILMLLVTIVTPKVIKQLNTSEDTIQHQQINTLIDIAKIYTNQNTNKLPEENYTSIITIEELKQSGLINKKQIVDPKTKEELTGCILIKDENNKYKYEYREECNIITVTFDAQGGELDQTTKNVLYHESYGGLPIPTKEGYTFMGWNGKNMFDEESIFMQIEGAQFIDEYYEFDVDKAYQRYSNKIPNIIFKENNKYTMTIKGYSIPNVYEYTGFRIIFNYIDGTTTSQSLSSKTENTIKYTSENGKTLEKLTMNYGYKGKVYISQIQLEEGDTATPYEPYYITNDTTVVQENNHTLKAIWQAN